MAGNYCTQCGEKLDPQTRFCGNCGAPRDSSANTQHPHADTQPETKSSPPPASRRKRWVLVGLGAFAVIAGGRALYLSATGTAPGRGGSVASQTVADNPPSLDEIDRQLEQFPDPVPGNWEVKVKLMRDVGEPDRLYEPKFDAYELQTIDSCKNWDTFATDVLSLLSTEHARRESAIAGSAFAVSGMRRLKNGGLGFGYRVAPQVRNGEPTKVLFTRAVYHDAGQISAMLGWQEFASGGTGWESEPRIDFAYMLEARRIGECP
ncbi:zinc-ribbon domain-containing protein [Aurantiacibacter xanthus]|uniref:zinc-ribbon domain-containing protein n=1 Tax=Aurantiacibacter xanthus TaxID=1784712 RepID=UPI00174D95C3|nr:zinc ribbon domain-containing protein [Aurantiacibacter xanthus]